MLLWTIRYIGEQIENFMCQKDTVYNDEIIISTDDGRKIKFLLSVTNDMNFVRNLKNRYRDIEQEEYQYYTLMVYSGIEKGEYSYTKKYTNAICKGIYEQFLLKGKPPVVAVTFLRRYARRFSLEELADLFEYELFN